MAKNNIDFRQTKFYTSATKISQLKDSFGVEVAFAGCSNAGKSSALNALTNQKNLAKTSKTPGRTQMINIFRVTERFRLVDLPGYGFAKVPLEKKKEWQRKMSEYLEKRECLKGLVVIMDIRHPLKELDQDMVRWAYDSNLEIMILLTKADKLTPSKVRQTVEKVRKAVDGLDTRIAVYAFSAPKKHGIKESLNVISEWFNA